MKTPLTALATLTLLAQASNLDPSQHHAWAQNIGWINLRPAQPTPTSGILVEESLLSGHAWAQNAGWIHFGNGSPLNGIRYSNTTANDCGVNLLADGSLSGYAWAQNIGWIRFDPTQPSPPQHPHIDLTTGTFSGYAWSQNTGWINLGTSLKTQSIALLDSDADGLDDRWETEFLVKPSLAEPLDDPDGDGFSNLDEFLAGTHPSNPSSRLRILDFSLDPSTPSATLIHSSQPGRLFRLNASSDLSSWDSSTWQAATQGTMTWQPSLKTPLNGKTFFTISAKRPLTP